MKVILHGHEYDLTHFKHPGGNIIEFFDGVDASVVYASTHSHDVSILDAYKVKEKQTNKPSYDFTTPFANDVRRLNFKNSHIAPIEWWVRYVLINIVWMYFEVMYVHPTMLNSTCLGITYALIGLCIGHDGSHGAVSTPRINEFMAMYMNVIGLSHTVWFKRHVMQHHPYTNEHKFDPDTPPYDWLKRWYAFIIWLLGPSIVFNFKSITKTRKRHTAILFRLFFLYRMFYSSYLYGLYVIFVTGFVLSNLFIVSHNTKLSKRNAYEESNDWYKNQVETSSTYGGKLAGYITGGLNYQIEHHCFPKMNSMYYPFISDKLKKVCKKHEVQYTYFDSFISNMVNVF